MNEVRKEYIKNNKEKIREKEKQYREANKELRKQKRREYLEKNKEKIKEYRKKYYEATRELKPKENIITKVKNKRVLTPEQKNRKKEYNLLYNKKRRKEDSLFKLRCITRYMTWRLFKTNYKKSVKTDSILGCSFDEFKSYLESKFEPWMTWGNHGLYNGEFNYGWDIDHIQPLSSVETEEDIVRLNHYTNLQPLCSKINRYVKKDNHS
jgi:hypothetical protein